MVDGAWRGGKYAEKRRNIFIKFIKCTTRNKTKDDRGCEAAIALQQSRGDMRHAPVNGGVDALSKAKRHTANLQKIFLFYYI